MFDSTDRRAPGPRREIHFFFAASFFILTAVFLHWQVLLSPSTRVLAGGQVGGYFSWLFWNWFEALRHGLPLLHTNLIMYPQGVPLFPHSPVNEIPAVLMQFFITPYAAFNLLMISGYALTGVCAYALMHRLTRNPAASLLGGYCYAFSAYMVVQHSHGQVIEATLFFNPLFALSLERFLDSATWRRAAWAGAALTGVFLSGPYVAFCFGMTYGVAAVAHDRFFGSRRILRPRAAERLAAAAVCAGVVAGLFYWPMLMSSGHWLGGDYFYSASVASFIDPPDWNPIPFVQTFRPLRGFAFFPEEGMSYLGAGVSLLVAYAVAKKDLRRDPVVRFWLWIFFVSAVLSLGPKLRLVPGAPINVVLPYWLATHVPVLSSFRNSARMQMTVTLASSALAALAFRRLSFGWRRSFQAAAAAGLIVLNFVEIAPFHVTQNWVSSAPTPIYEKIRTDPGTFAIMELPILVGSDGGISVSAQYYMLLQPRHRHPMVLGYPSRYPAASLTFTENTDFVYELIHPAALARLDQDPALKTRARWLASRGRQFLDKAGIKYVVFHPRIAIVSPAEMGRLRAWLDRTLGPAVFEEENGDRLYATNDRS